MSRSLPKIPIPPHLQHTLPEITQTDLSEGTRIHQGDYCDVIKLTKNGITYAVKNIYKKQLPKPTYKNQIQQIANEIKVLYLIQHQNVIQLLGHFENDASIMLIFPCFGKSLRKFIKIKAKRDNNRYNLSIFMKIFRQILMAVNQLHCLGYVHRDVTADNILIDQQFNLKLCDFGCVSNIYGRKTETGTCQYFAPEILEGRKYNHKIDVWALGILSFELLYGINLFEPERKNNDLEETKRGYLNNMRKALPELLDEQLIVTEKPGVQLLSNLKCMLNVNPEKRPQTGYLLSRQIFGAQKSEAGKYEMQQFIRKKTQRKTNKFFMNIDGNPKQMGIVQLQSTLFGLINAHSREIQHQQSLLSNLMHSEDQLSQLRISKYKNKQ